MAATDARFNSLGDPVALARFFCERVPHSRDLGMAILPTEGPQACMRLVPQAHFLDEPGESICSSVLYSLADSAAGLAVFAATRTLTPIATLDLRMNYLRPAPCDHALVVDARCEAVTDDVAFVRCLVHAEGSREQLATGDATFMRSTRGRRFDAAPPLDTRPASLLQTATPAPNLSKPARSYAQYLGVEVLGGSDGLRLHLPFREALIGNIQIPALHGGVLGGLIEEAARVAVGAGQGENSALRILNCDIDYLRSARTVDSYATAEIVRRTRRTVLARVVCWQSEDRVPVATGRVQILLNSSTASAEPSAAEASA
ncbi:MULTISPECIES: PaaI family thioesterase [Solimonas]|uniref:PaaI family thioesterase n=1 Tax=Solimonas TaxID=413435 RepID=UPI0013FD89B4|nr:MULTISPECIES: PaaI family thioesterase [Solimonas]MDM4771606.1 PaaI family thioesterase [Solimonas sp. SE-A11]